MEKNNKTGILKTPGVAISKSLLFFGYWLPVFVWMITIFVLSSQHSVRVAPDFWLNFAFFKMLHVIEYMIFFTLSYRATSASLPSRKSLWGIVAFVMTVAYAASDEIHQMFTPTREPTLRDVIIDTIGAGLIWYYLSALLPKAPKRLKKLARSLGIPS